MGYLEAVEDNIRIIRPKQITSITVYYPLCDNCGAEVMTYNYKRGTKYLCKNCRTIRYMQDKQAKKMDNLETKNKRLEKALKRIEKVANLKYYSKAIQKIKDNLQNDNYYQSTEEIMTALELERRNIDYIHQQKIGIYTVDFLINNKKIVLEIDGTTFHTENTRAKENVRDNYLCLMLGSEWEVIRITDKLINQNVTKLVKAIDKTYETRKKIRAKNNGTLPEWYNDRKI